ncbi:Transposase DDE domain protein [compost metagenome]
MSNIHNIKVIRQCFSYLTEEEIRLPVADHRVHKFTTMKCAKLIMASQLAKWESHNQTSRELRTSQVLQESVGLPSISASQISRRLKQIPTEMLEAMFLDIMSRATSLIPIGCSKIGPLRIVDSTRLIMPDNLAKWANVSGKSTQIRIHVRILALPQGHIVPEKAIPSTGNVSDYETMDLLVEDDGTIYVMDRGYVKYKQFDAWTGSGVRFVTRINEKHGVLRVEKELPVPANSNIVRDAIVQLGSAFRQTEKLLRLVEFLDDQGRKYRLATSCLDLDAIEIADIYRQRWLIELFFKWMKQHLRLVKLYSYEPQGVWNQIFLALITYAIAMHIQLESGTKLSLWDVLQSLRCCWYKAWNILQDELYLPPTRKSRGRQKRASPVEKESPRLLTTVGIMKPSSFKRKDKR